MFVMRLPNESTSITSPSMRLATCCTSGQGKFNELLDRLAQARRATRPKLSLAATGAMMSRP